MMRRDRFIAVCERTVRPTQISVYSLSTMTCLAKFDTGDNPTGVAAVSCDTSFILVMPALSQGSVRLHNFTTKDTKEANLHNSPLSVLALDFQGRVCASASQLGTVIRVFSCEDMTTLHELRRGRYSASMTSLSFSPSLEYLCGTSDHCTLHVWSLKQSTPSYVESFISSVVTSYKPYPSIAKLRITQSDLRTTQHCRLLGPVAFFLTDSEIAVACLDGNLHRVVFDTESCSLQLTESLDFLEKRLFLMQSTFLPSV
jgi:WD40 repeat protein